MMAPNPVVPRCVALVALVVLASNCSSDRPEHPVPAPTNPQDGPAAGYADGHATVPAEGQAEDVSSPTTVVGTGTAESCTGDEFVAAVAKGGIITFDCGPNPVTITLTQTAKVFNDRGTKLVIDGGNKVALSGAG